VTGLANAEAAAVKLRIEEVATGLGLEIQPASCRRANIEIGFTNDPQHMLDDVTKTNRRLMGDPTSGTQSASTVTLPVQAWYLTNGRDVSANDVGGLKALAADRSDDWAALKMPVLYQVSAPGPEQQPTPSSNPGGSNDSSGANKNPVPRAPFGDWQSADDTRQFYNVLVIVDLNRTESANLRLLSDYVTMLAFSQPQSLGSCQALPSITDLFAACPERATLAGLTVADTAYLHALYAAGQRYRIGHPLPFAQVHGDYPALIADVVDGMAPLLADTKMIVH
jgi:hypothetical protein